MKKIFTLSFVVLGMLMFLGQSTYAQKSLKGNGEVFYSTTFDWADPTNEQGWTAPEGFTFQDPDDIGFNWHWYPNDSLISLFVSEPPSQATSREDGSLCLFLNRYNEGNDPRIDVNNGIQFPTMDCSSHSSVILRYETNFMAYSTTAGMEILVSNDAGVHWASFAAGFGNGHKARPNGIAAGEVTVFEANISDVAAGMSEVLIQIKWSGTSIYFWIIDDFQLAEAWDNDLRMDYFTAEWDDGDENTKESISYNMPISQLGGSMKNFEASITNFGELDQNETYLSVDIMKNNASVFNATGVTTDPWLSPLLTDTVTIETAYTPTEFGHYKISFDAGQDETEQTPENDMNEAFFNITDSVYSRAGDVATESFVWGLDAYGTEGEPNEQHFVGCIFPIYGNTEVDAVSVYVTGGLADGEIEFRSALFLLPDPEEEDQTPIPWITSESVVLDSSMFNTWVTLPVEKDGESEFLMEGDVVYAGVEYWNWHTENIPYKRYQNFAIGANKGIRDNDPVSIVRSLITNNFGQGITQGRKLMVRLLLNDHSNRIDGVDLATSASQLEQNYPNPAVDMTQIQYELGSDSKVVLEITDMTGRVVLQQNEGNLPAGKHSIEINTKNFESGVYFYTLKAGAFVATKRMIIAN